MDERFFIKWLVEFFYILALGIICKWLIIKFSQKNVFEEGKCMNSFNKEKLSEKWYRGYITVR